MKRKAVLMLILTYVMLLTGCAKQADIHPNVSHQMRDAVQESWDVWNALSKERQILSSSAPGNCQQGFDDWLSCEEYMGLTAPNPLEDCDWLEKGTYAAMPIGYADAPHVMMNWYGEENGTIEKVRVTAGYQKDDIRIILLTDIYGTATFVAAKGDITATTEQSYFSMECNIVEDNVLYRLKVIGKPDAQAQVEEVFTQVQELFPE